MLFIDQLPNAFQHQKSPKGLNLQTFTVWVTPQTFLIEPSVAKSRISTMLEINRKTKHIIQHNTFASDTKKHAKPFYFSCFIGIIDLNGKKIVLLAEKVDLVGAIGQRDIFMVSKPIFLFYSHQQKQKISQKQAELLLNITSIFQQGMYFSFSYDLSLTLNSTSEDKNNSNAFNWAHNFQKQLVPFNHLWSISVIQGYVGKMQVNIQGLKINIVLISRRSNRRGGTAAYARGIDDQGFAGNYVQTEQIIIVKDYYFSYVMVRGTAPVYWHEQNSYGFNTIKCTGSYRKNYQSFQTHIRRIIQKKYSFILLLNLLSQTKQQKLLQNFEYVSQQLESNLSKSEHVPFELKYAYFDIHKHNHSKQYIKLDVFLQHDIEKLMNGSSFNAIKVNRDKREKQIINFQKGIIRTSCYTCIDRTNIVQSRIAALKFIEIVKFLNIQIKDLRQGLNFLNHQTPFSTLYRTLWADNSDFLSKQYTGTGSTQSLAQRKGKLSYLSTLDHGMKSLYRVIRNLRNQDEKKQEAICFILGQQFSRQNYQNSQKNTKKDVELTKVDNTKYKLFQSN